MSYSCNNCNKSFVHKSDYTKHQNRKNKCEIIIQNNDLLDKSNLTCSGCSKQFSRRDVLHLWRFKTPIHI